MTTPLRRRLGLALLVSLGLNLFLGGMVASNWLRQAPPPPGPRGHFDRMAARHAVSPAYRDLVERIWRRNAGELRLRMGAVHEARQTVRRGLVAEPFDRQALARAHAALSARLMDARAAMEANIAEIAAALPPEERQRYFAASLRPGPGGRPRDRPRGRHRRP
jgi:uncharacterized membrane protein